MGPATRDSIAANVPGIERKGGRREKGQGDPRLREGRIGSRCLDVLFKADQSLRQKVLGILGRRGSLNVKASGEKRDFKGAPESW